MTIQEDMFALVAEWKSSSLTKKTFLADKPIGLPKFNYWCDKHGQHMNSATLPSVHETDHFRKLIIDDRAADAEQLLVCELSKINSSELPTSKSLW